VLLEEAFSGCYRFSGQPASRRCFSHSPAIWGRADRGISGAMTQVREARLAMSRAGHSRGPSSCSAKMLARQILLSLIRGASSVPVSDSG
jgi:hypothetical protein